MIVNGLKACDTCRKALKALGDAQLRDVREAPLSADEIADFLGRFGEDLINKRSTTWRGLSEAERVAPPADLIAAHPTLMKRPVIVSDRGTTLGWDDAARQVHLGDGAGSD